MSKDLTGKKFGRLTILREVARKSPLKRRWLCLCECGNKLEINHTRLTTRIEPTKSCGCLNRRISDISAKKFGRLYTLEKVIIKNKPHWLCICDCGKTVTVNHHKLLSGHTQSCGCLQIDRTRTHGKTDTPLFRRWAAILSRCNYKENKWYKNYGGRGIKVLWTSFQEFEKDMGSSFSKELSIDRIDNNGHYCKENCRWTDKKTQNLNKRNNHYLSHDGKVQTIVEWAKDFGMNANTLTGRLKRGWSLEDALNKKPLSRGFNKKGVSLSATQFPGTVGHKLAPPPAA